MQKPNFQRVMETFILTLIPEGAARGLVSPQALQQAWQDYLDLLRSKVAPLIRELVDKGIIGWYSFLMHGKDNGVPTVKDDNGFYIHLRVELTETSNEAELRAHLPPWCLMTQKMLTPNSMDRINIQTLRGEEVEQGYKVLGEASEWVLKMLACHDPGKPIPAQNVSQFLHYIGNQLLVQAVGIQMP